MCTTVHVKTYLEGCNNTHAQTGDHPKHKSSFIETWAHHPCFLTQLLHKLVPGVHGGYSCAKIRSESFVLKTDPIASQRINSTFIFLKKGKCD